MNISTPAMEAADSIDRFLEETSEKDTQARFERESERILRIEVDGGVFIKPGAAVAYRGEIKFERLATLDAVSASDAAMRELSPLVRAKGKGRLFVGHRGSNVRTVRLNGETLFVASQDLLAFEESLAFDTTLVGNGIGVAAGGMTAVRLSGHGALALACLGGPLTLRVMDGMPVSTAPRATLAWSGGLAPQLKTDLSWRSAIGHGGQQGLQMLFEGNGFVLVQPHDNTARFRPGVVRKRLKWLV
jgi:uncharacterized protein (AIM24 family)